MKRAVLSALVMLSLTACTPSSYQHVYADFPTAQADKLTASAGEPVEVTLRGGFGVEEVYDKESYTTAGVNLGTCVNYAPEPTTDGGLCIGGERPLPDGLSIVGEASFSKNFGDITVRRGELRRIEHTFSFTSDRAGVIRLVPFYLFTSEFGDPQVEPGADSILQITFE